MKRSLLLLSALTAGIQAQAPEITPLPTRAPWTEALIDEPRADGVFWVRGTNYKAGVDGMGATYYPRFLAAETHTPLQFRYRGAGNGKATRHGQMLAIQHDATLTEQWHARTDGIEQRFVLTAPRDRGDLVLPIAVATDLTFRGQEQGLVFGNALGNVRYGEGIVFDAAGRSAPIVPEYSEQTIWLRVPAAFLADAAWPVTIDPLVTTLGPIPADNDIHPDIARDPSGNGDFIVIYENVFSSADHDILGARYRTDGTLMSNLIFDATTDSCIDPQIAPTLSATGLLAVWDNNGVGDGIEGRRYRLTLSTMDSLIQIISDGIGIDSRTPDVGGGAMVGGATLGQMVVYTRVSAGVNFSLRGIPVQGSGIPAGSEFVIDGTPGCDPRPRISQNAGQPLFWAVVWQQANVACNGDDIWWATVEPTGVQRAASALASDSDDEFLPTVHVHDDDVLFAWHTTTTSFGHDTESEMWRRTSPGNTFAQVGIGLRLPAAEPGCPRAANQNLIAVAHDGCRYTYAYMEDQRPKAACMFAPSYLFSEGHVALSTTTNNCGATAIAHTPTADSGVRFCVVWQEDVGAVFGIRGAFYDGREPGAVTTTVQTGCGSHGIETGIELTELPYIGHRFGVQLTNVAGLPLLVIGSVLAAPIPLCSAGVTTCQQGFGFAFHSEITANYSVVIPCDPSFRGMRLAFQGADLGAPLGCGSSAFGLPLRTTDTLQVSLR